MLKSLLVAAAALAAAAPVARAADQALISAVQGSHRSETNKVRDKDRHPLQTLQFFGLRSDATVVEIWPGGGYWTEILAPFLKDHGVYYVALPGKGATETANAEAEKFNAAFRPEDRGRCRDLWKVTPTARSRPDRNRAGRFGGRHADVPQPAQLA